MIFFLFFQTCSNISQISNHEFYEKTLCRIFSISYAMDMMTKLLRRKLMQYYMLSAAPTGKQYSATRRRVDAGVTTQRWRNSEQ